MIKLAGILFALILIAIPFSHAQVQCGFDQYVMNNKCYDMPDNTPELNTDLGIYEPQLSDQQGNPKTQFMKNERTYISIRVDNLGIVSHEFKVGVKYLKPEIGEWSKEKYAKSVINPLKESVIILPFLIANDMKTIQIKATLYDEYGIVYTQEKILESFITESDNLLIPEISNSIIDETKPIPLWVKGIFDYYVQGKISDAELKEALVFLINSKIINL